MDSEQRQNVCVAVDLLRDHSTSHVKQALYVCIRVCVGEQGLYALAGEDLCKRSFSRLANPARFSVEFIMFGFLLGDFWDTMVYFIFLLQGNPI